LLHKNTEKAQKEKVIKNNNDIPKELGKRKRLVVEEKPKRATKPLMPVGHEPELPKRKGREPEKKSEAKRKEKQLVKVYPHRESRLTTKR